MNIILSVLNILLSPYSFFFLFLIPKELQDFFFEPTSVNTNRLKVFPFFIFISFYLLVCIGSLYSLRFLTVPSFEMWEVFIPTYYWLSIPCWFVTIITYKTYFQGMEGNIMGFIFFPMILLSSGALILVNISTLFSHFSVESPTITLNIWLKIALLGFSPVMVAVFSAQPKEKEDNNVLALMIANYIFLSMIFALHWILFKLFGRNLSLGTFFFSDASILYYLPFVGGMIHFAYFFLTKKNYLQKTTAYGIPNVLITLVSFFSIILQMINYVAFLKNVW